jgi:hypothetical protein
MVRRGTRALTFPALGTAAAMLACASFEGADEDPARGGGPGNLSDAGGATAANDPCIGPPPAPEVFAETGGAVANVTSTLTHVSWLAGGAVQRRDIGRTAPVQTLTDAVTLGRLPAALVAVGDWAIVAAANELYAVPTTGEGPTKMGVAGPPLAANSTHFYASGPGYSWMGTPPRLETILNYQSGVSTLAANEVNLYTVGTPPDGQAGRAVYRVESGTATLVFHSLSETPTRLAVDGSELFMVDRDLGHVFKAGAPDAAVMLADNEPDLGGITVLRKQVYYATSQGIRRIAASGAGCRAILSTTAVDTFTVTDGHVYFASGANVVRDPR